MLDNINSWTKQTSWLLSLDFHRNMNLSPKRKLRLKSLISCLIEKPIHNHKSIAASINLDREHNQPLHPTPNFRTSPAYTRKKASAEYETRMIAEHYLLQPLPFCNCFVKMCSVFPGSYLCRSFFASVPRSPLPDVLFVASRLIN
jgi:hypothetical protein